MSGMRREDGGAASGAASGIASGAAADGIAAYSAAAHTLWIGGDGRVRTFDQTRLPFREQQIAIDTLDDGVRAIATMQVRGAPLIGVVAAYALALALRETGGEAVQAAHARLLATRPTAVNLRWALDRVRARVLPLEPPLRAAAAWAEADAIRREDIACNRAIGEHGVAALRALIAIAAEQRRPLQLLTHCNAGALATVAWGTALAPIYLLRERGVPLHVWVDETRPRNQGAALTAWELARGGIDHTVVADNAGGLLMMRGQVDAVIVGCDRVAANGDVVNKIGTYLKALAAAAHAVPFFVACPVSTIDPACASGADVVIEERDAQEVSIVQGMNEHGDLAQVRIVPAGSRCANPAFDVTPAALVGALLTERGVCAAQPRAIADLLAQPVPAAT